MKILVVSDSHGRWGALYNVIQAEPDARVVIHLGDGNEDLERLRPQFPGHVMVGIAGNCDFFAASGLRACDMISAEDKNIFFTHGHNYRVKSGYSLVEQAARARNADVCLFGHTHEPFAECRNGLYMMNPGSVGLPRNGGPSYGIIKITNGVISTQIKTLDQ